MRDVSQLKRMQKGIFFDDLNSSASLLWTPPPPPGRHRAAVLMVLILHRCRVMLPAPNFRAVISRAGDRHLGSCRLLLFFFHNNNTNKGISYPPPSLAGISKELLLFWRSTALYQSARCSAVNYLKIETSLTRCLSWSPNPPVTETKG